MRATLILLLAIAVSVIGLAVFYLSRQFKAQTRDRIGLANSMLATMLAFVSVAVAIIGLNEGGRLQQTTTTQTADDGGVVVGGGNSGQGICVYVTGDCVANPPEPNDLAKLSPDQAMAELAEIPGADNDPTGSGPWIYLVLGTNEQGVFYRDGYTIDDRRLAGEPVVSDGRPIYVECRVNDGFLADPSAPNKDLLTTWLNVRYPEPGTAGDYWVYGAYTFPVGHNGNVPMCAAGS